MPAPISVVVPTLDAAGELATALASLLPATEAGLVREVIVSDGGSADGTLAIADEAGCRVVTGSAGRGAQLSRGAAAARGAWLLFLHADTVLSDGWGRAAASQLARPGQAGVFRLALKPEEAGRSGASLPPRLVAGGANVRARLFGLPYGDQGLLLAQSLYAQVGGYDPDLPLFEDVDLVRRLRRARGRGALRLLPAYAITSPRRYERDGYARRVAANQMLLARYLAGASPARLAARYR